jgi:hypothetical protein
MGFCVGTQFILSLVIAIIPLWAFYTKGNGYSISSVVLEGSSFSF